MLSSPGIAIPRASAACSAPTAISSLIAISAVGRSARSWERLWVADLGRGPARLHEA
jgi:hypothetical protein